MRTQTRFVLALAVTAAVVLSVGLRTVSAQAAATSADAAKFIGAWTLGLDTPQGAMSMNLTLKDNAGSVAGSLTSDIAPDAQAITDITKDGDKLVLRYSMDFQGQAIPAQITLVPAGDKYTASFDFAGGQFVMDGTAVKK
jgi:hypothetical protein